MLYRQFLSLCCLTCCFSVMAWSDSDQDGVPDKKDACAGTPIDVVVLANGCQNNLVNKNDNNDITKAELIETVIPSIYFDFGQSTILLTQYPNIERAYELIEKSNFTTVELVGYTDNVGSELINARLSLQRAESVKALLVQQFDINAGDIEVFGLGIALPESSNNSVQNRQKNRRVEFKIK